MRAGREAWQAILDEGEPVGVDVPIWVRKLPEHSSPSKLVVEVLDAQRGRLGSAAVFPGGWSPGGRREFSHYFPVLRSALGGLESRGLEPLLRLRLLKAVNAGRALGRERPYVVLLKFVVAPEFAITGARAERVYQCPLSGFYRHFMNLGSDVLRDASAPAFVGGQAIHRGYARAARAYVDTGDDERARAAYFEGVVETWRELFSYLLLDRPGGRAPTQLYRLPIEAADAVVGRCCQLYDGRAGEIELFQERLFFSPTRGISGRADRIVENGEGRELWELKTRSSGWAVDKDPRSGRAAPGGVQALAYHEILRTVDGAPPRTAVELLDPNRIEGIPLESHPVVTRADADVRAADDRYIDLVAQARNVAYVVESGLLTGYDREKLAQVAKQGSKLRAVGGDFDLYGSAPPCSFCPAGQRGLCEASRSPGAAPWFDFFRHVPDLLFEYWAWFHGQLKQGENADKERLYHLVTTSPERLERDEGSCVTDLEVGRRDGRLVTLRRRRRVETRLREDDRVLVTRLDRPPGEVYSIEATIRSIGTYELAVDLVEPLPIDGARYRVDRLGFWDRGDWQLEGLTDFLVGCLQGGVARGRRLEVAELPRLARVILGVDVPKSISSPSGAGPHPPTPLRAGDSQGGWGVGSSSGLNASQQVAVEVALGLEAGELLLVQGPPGTGKTTMIAELVRRLAIRDFWREPSEPRPVLVLANTHRACNEVVLKLHRRFPDLRPYLVRLGPARAGMEPEVREHVLAERLGVGEVLGRMDLAREGPEALVRLVKRGNALHDEALVFVGTLAGANRPELRGLEFETIVVDETGQATEPAALQALRHAVRGYRSRLILVGDHRQLPPVVPDEITAPTPPATLAPLVSGGGCRVSLFERLATRHPEAVLTLAEQYRMCGPISDLVSEVFYEGRLRPGDAAVAEHDLGRFLARVGVGVPTEGVAGRVLDPPATVVLIDTAGDPRARDTVSRLARDETRDNPREAELIADILTALLGSLAPDRAAAVAREIGVISPYRKQNNRIRQELQRIGPLAGLVRVDTVDRFQGGECELIFLSLVASNSAGSVGALHADWRRMNVAISRARAKLVIVGDRQTFTRPSTPEEEPAKVRYRRLFELVDRQAGAGRALVLASDGWA